MYDCYTKENILIQVILIADPVVKNKKIKKQFHCKYLFVRKTLVFEHLKIMLSMTSHLF